MTAEQSLLDLLAIQMGCTYLSDLKFLTEAQRVHLAHKLEPLTPREEDLDQWNDALDYLTGAPPETNASMAKDRLLQLLSESDTARKTLKRRKMK